MLEGDTVVTMMMEVWGYSCREEGRGTEYAIDRDHSNFRPHIHGDIPGIWAPQLSLPLASFPPSSS
jgi:hypothetical protein